MFARLFDVWFEMRYVSFVAIFTVSREGAEVDVTGEMLINEPIFLRRLIVIGVTLSGDCLSRVCAENQSRDEDEFQA